jgi:hypothetical protein
MSATQYEGTLLPLMRKYADVSNAIRGHHRVAQSAGLLNNPIQIRAMILTEE